MNTIYNKILQNRQDLTIWLLHFTKKSRTKPAREVLLSILTEGVLRPGFAERGSPPRKTIYGPFPAVCFSEQPLGALVQSLEVRKEPEALDGYGVLVHKHDAYIAGALPVIYGLNAPEEEQDPKLPDRRVLTESCLPRREQFRYVAFNPVCEPHPLDWTHEREWRWPAVSSNGDESPLFDLSRPGYANHRGCFENRLHVFVNHDDDVSWLQTELQNGICKKLQEGENRWRLTYLKKMKLLSLDAARRNKFWRFEDWPEDEKHCLALSM